MEPTRMSFPASASWHRPAITAARLDPALGRGSGINPSVKSLPPSFRARFAQFLSRGSTRGRLRPTNAGEHIGNPAYWRSPPQVRRRSR